MSRQSTNFQLTQIFDPNQMSTLASSFNEFGNFIYKDHVTRMKYNVDHLKSNTSSLQQNQTLRPSFTLTHKQTKSMGNMTKIKSKFKTVHKDQMETKKFQLSHFLEQLQMMNKIRNNRNHIVSGTEKAQRRKTLFPSLYPLLMSNNRKRQNVDILKQQIRKQVNSLNTQLFREYMQNTEPYRMVYNELNTVSNKGALNTHKIKQIKQKIKQCTRKKDDDKNADSLIKRYELDSKQNSLFDQYFSSVAQQIDEEIHLKMKHQASYNWKYGKKSTIEDMLKNYQHQMRLLGNYKDGNQ